MRRACRCVWPDHGLPVMLPQWAARHSFAIAVIILFLFVSAVSCASQTIYDQDIIRLPPAAVPFALKSGLKRKAEIVISDAGLWAKTWTTINSIRRPARAVPDVDFSQSIVVVVAAGSQNSGGYSIEIVGGKIIDKLLRVSVIETRPGPTCIVSNDMTAPVDIAVFPRGPEKIDFDVQVVVQSCE